MIVLLVLAAIIRYLCKNTLIIYYVCWDKEKQL